ncbi:hypothetical protein SALBM311S_07204 [Streptomyces alboniger]
MATAVLGGLVLAVLNIPVFHLNDPGSTSAAAASSPPWPVRSSVRSRRHAQLVTERAVAEAAQLAVVPPPPAVGSCGARGPVSGRAARDAGRRRLLRRTGGAVRGTGRDGPCARAGLSAVATVASLLGAFREAVVDQPDAESVAARLDRPLLDSTGAPNGLPSRRRCCSSSPRTPDGTDRGVRTAQSAAATRSAGRDPARPQPPLGLGLPDGGPPAGLTVPLESGDLFFLASDGVRPGEGPLPRVLPLTDRLSGSPPRTRTRSPEVGRISSGTAGPSRTTSRCSSSCPGTPAPQVTPAGSPPRRRCAEGPGPAGGCPPGVPSQQGHHRRDHQQAYDAASISTLTARPSPSIFTTMLSLMMNAENTLTMISAAQATTPR